jgi:hypothetical protein
MQIRRVLSSSLVALSIVVALIALVACDNSGGAKVAHVTAGQMPAGETWSGVYFHPVFGYLHMVEQDGNVIGRWKRADQSAWGELSGTRQGNVLRFRWKEHKIGQYGPSGESSGKGYFIYTVNRDGIGNLEGHYGLHDDETGSNWNNVKQQRMVPDLKSITGNDSSGGDKPGGSEWH